MTGAPTRLRPKPDEAPQEARLAVIERMLAEQRQADEERIASLTDAVRQLHRLLEGRGAIAAPAPGAAAEIAAAAQQITALSQALAAIETSTTWRATAPLRKLASRLSPSTRAALRRLARRTYWLLTPHRRSMRRQWVVYAPQNEQTVQRLAALSTAARDRLRPLRRAYGPSPIEELDIYPTNRPAAPIFLFIHGGGWRAAEARNAAFAADLFVGAGAVYVALDFIGCRAAGGDLRVIVEQVRRGVAWVYQNAASFGGDPDRLYLGGHSSGAHLCAMALVSDWQGEFGLPADLVKGALLMSGIYDLGGMRRSRYSPQLVITDEIEEMMSPLRHVARLQAPLVITCGGAEAPAFRRQSRDLCAAAIAAGKTAELIEPPHFGHLEMAEALASPYMPNGRAALALMRLSPG